MAVAPRKNGLQDVPPPAAVSARRWLHWQMENEMGKEDAPELPAGGVSGKGQSPQVAAGTGDLARKTLANVADVLRMSRVDANLVPPADASAEGGDILDSLVQEHLQRAGAPEGRAPAAQEGQDEEHVEEPVLGGASAEERAANLQKEIEALLSGEPKAGAPAEPAGTAAVKSEAAGDGGEAGKEPSTGDLSVEELAVLLSGGEGKPEGEAAKNAEAVSAPTSVEKVDPPAAVGAGAAPVAEAAKADALDDEASKVLEAEGVLAEELAQLMAETEAAETAGNAEAPAAPAKVEAAAAADPAALPQKSDEELTAAVQSIMQGRGMISKEEGEKPEARSQEPEGGRKKQEAASKLQEASSKKQEEATVAAADAAVVKPAQATAPAAVAPPPGVPEHPVIELELPEGIVPRAKLGTRIVRMLQGILMLVLQAIDLPFAWLQEWDKNLIGIAALCLLLGGCVLYGWAWWLAHHV